ncbi:hypothetical protein QB910_000058 [Dabrowskivirus KKP3916]|uniref:Polymerase/histidinol phosphatase N-terminal domain-containing protein n=1 Tax=Alicyclobacillus phage KKP_3916 TaxID=3040651 RepID=A0AAT9V7J7_9CAUD|nr:hypothetical protein QB910_000058 [Alicyclobacillus phage KKP 3916]
MSIATNVVMRRFSSLHNHTFYSILDAVMSPAELVQQAYDLGYKAVAVTEHGNMHSFVEAFKKANELGIKLIVGMEAYEVDDMDYKKPDQKRFHLILLAKNETGLKNLFKIATEGHVRGFYVKPRIDLKLLKKYSEGIICMSSCLGGRINRIMTDALGVPQIATEEQIAEAKRWIAKYKSIFGDDYYLEMQSHNTDEQFVANQNLYKLARETNTEYTITFDTHIRDGSDIQKDVHSKFLLIGQDREAGEIYEGCWQQTMDEVHATMDKHIGYDAVEHGIEVTDVIADKCNVEIKLHQDLMPHIKIPKKFKSDVEYLKYLVNQGWKWRGLNVLSKEANFEYKVRLRNELEVIEYLDYVGYFIMLHQLYAKFRERKIPLGYGRGSAGGSLMLYLLGVTEVDSIKWELDFARFANKGRKGSVADCA